MSTSVRDNGAIDDGQVVTEAINKKGRAGIVKNKLKRQLLYRKERLRKAREKRDRKQNRKREAEQLGEEVS